MLTIIAMLSLGKCFKNKSRDPGSRPAVKLVRFRWLSVAHPHSKLIRSRRFWKPEVSGKPKAWSKKCHKVTPVKRAQAVGA
jgi:hypothetical protein